jgi:GxxExxY protein
MNKDPLTSKIIGCAIEVHKELGPGLLERTYLQCFAHEMKLNGIEFIMECALPVKYKGFQLDCGYRIDLLVENKVIVELKAVETIHDIYRAQLLTYMKLTNISTGLLMNFNEERLKDGIQRFKL